MAINTRCPLQAECEKKCKFEHHELDCSYYKANGWGDNVIPDQEERRDALSREHDLALEEAAIEEMPDVAEDTGVRLAGGMIYLPVDRLHPHPDNPRKELGDLTELADSIRENGILQNLTVVFDDPERTDSDFTVIIGHRRLAAAKLAGLETVPCVIAAMTPKEQVATMLLENMQRSDLTVYEQAQGFQMMLDMGSTVDEIAEKSGFSTTTVRRRVKMMELDQKTLKNVSDRQLSLADFDTLAQIEDISERNKVLESIGTRDFNQNVSYALRKQKEKKNLPLIKAWLEEIGAKEIQSSDTYGTKYEKYDSNSDMSISSWDEESKKLPKSFKVPIFYVLSNWGTLSLYKKAAKKKPVKKSEQQVNSEKAIQEAWDSLSAAASTAYDLRSKFAGELTVTGKNRCDILYGALLAGMLEVVEYNSPERNAICRIFGINVNAYDDRRGEKLLSGIENIKDSDIVPLIYAAFGDSKEQMCVSNAYKGVFPEYKVSVKLTIIYKWLTMLGYELSTEEQSLLNGEHPAYKAEAEFKEAGKNG